MAGGRRASPYPIIKGKIQSMADALLGLPESGVWLHERQLHPVVGATSGEKFGPRDCFSCVVDGIGKGYWGNKKKNDFVDVAQGALVGFSEEGSKHNVAFQEYGRQENFPGGRLDTSPVVGKPRWFRSGETLCKHVEDQLKLVEQLMGEAPELQEDVALRRQHNYASFVKGIKEDGGYSRHDLPFVAYEWRDIWGEDIVANDRFPHMRRAFKPNDWIKIEQYMRLVIVASNKYGKLEVSDGVLGPSSSARPARGHVLPVEEPAKDSSKKRSECGSN